MPWAAPQLGGAVAAAIRAALEAVLCTGPLCTGPGIARQARPHAGTCGVRVECACRTWLTADGARIGEVPGGAHLAVRDATAALKVREITGGALGAGVRAGGRVERGVCPLEGLYCRPAEVQLRGEGVGALSAGQARASPPRIRAESARRAGKAVSLALLHVVPPSWALGAGGLPIKGLRGARGALTARAREPSGRGPAAVHVLALAGGGLQGALRADRPRAAARTATPAREAPELRAEDLQRVGLLERKENGQPPRGRAHRAPGPARRAQSQQRRAQRARGRAHPQPAPAREELAGGRARAAEQPPGHPPPLPPPAPLPLPPLPLP